MIENFKRGTTSTFGVRGKETHVGLSMSNTAVSLADREWAALLSPGGSLKC